MRICSLLPGATEIAYLLGLGDQIVGVTHECDYPHEAKQKPVVVRSVIDSSQLSCPEIIAESANCFKQAEACTRSTKPLSSHPVPTSS